MSFLVFVNNVYIMKLSKENSVKRKLEPLVDLVFEGFSNYAGCDRIVIHFTF